MSNTLASLKKRLAALLDKSAWLLIVPVAIALALLDVSAAKTMLEWTLFGLPLAGLSIIISRIVFPQIDLTALVREVMLENRAAATLASAVILFVGMVMIALVLWAKT